MYRRIEHNNSKSFSSRQGPGILIFTKDQKLVYLNGEARKIIYSLERNRNNLKQNQHVQLSLPTVVVSLCDRLERKPESRRARASNKRQVRLPVLPAIFSGKPYLCRGFFLSNHTHGTDDESYMLILIEPEPAVKR